MFTCAILRIRHSPARATIERNLARQASRGKIADGDVAAAMGRISTGKDLGAFGGSDLVIEAATENEEVKRAILKDLVPNLSATALIATNTSSISITRLAAVTDRPGKFIGMHFMNPVPVMQLVELIRGIATEQETFTAVKTLAEKLGKTVAVAEDFPAFIVNRILLPMINEAVYTLYEGVGGVNPSTPPCGSAPITRWARCNWPTSSASIPASR